MIKVLLMKKGSSSLWYLKSAEFSFVDNLINHLNLALICFSCFIHLASPVFNTLQLVTEQ